ncbi:MAG TPA: ATP-binding cassette domain-containing protein, partial [Anaerolineae bacterium]
MTEPILQVRNLSKAFGGILALNGVTFDVPHGEILAVIGPNGAGKTTLFNLISGVHPPTRGEVLSNGRTLNGVKPYERAALGIARTFQSLRLFENMSVLENVMVGQHIHETYGMALAALRLPRVQREEDKRRADALAQLELIGLADRADEPIGELPFGQQRLVQIARALASEPHILLLDEPAAGLTRSEIDSLDALLQGLKARGLTILLVEHDMQLVMNLADHLIVLNFGEKIAEGTPNEIRGNPAVIAAYLGKEKNDDPSVSLKDGEKRSADVPLLEIHDLSTFYGPIRALKGVNLQIMPGEIVALIGSNGAGKTTLLNTVAGLLSPRAGLVRYDGRDITGWRAEEVVRAGISLVPERRQVFSSLSVSDNLLLGTYAHRPSRTEYERDQARVLALFPVLKRRGQQPGGTLSGGEQQMLAIARGLVSRPRLLMLDEPSVGLAPILVREILRILVELSRDGTTILLVEQNAQAALSIADHAYVLETGRIALEGRARDLVRNPNV